MSTIYYYTVSEDNFTKNYVEKGVKIVVECLSAFNGVIYDTVSFEKALKSDKHHPISGGISLNVDDEYNVLIVEVVNIKIYSDIVWSISRSAGVKKDEYIHIGRTAYDRHFQIYKDEQIAVNPSIGFVGITSNDTLTKSSGRAGMHGGNIDLPFIKTGCKIFFPTNGIKNPSVWFGDLHARQGYGELSGISYECSGKIEVRLDCCYLSEKIVWPYAVFKNFNEYYIAFIYATYARTLEETIEGLVDYLLSVYELFRVDSREKMYEIIGVFGNLLIGQSSACVKTVAISFALKDLNVKSFIGNWFEDNF